MSNKIINTNDAPAAIGPYSQAVLNNQMIFTSGQLGINPNNGLLVSENIEEQTHQVIHNIKNILSEADCQLNDVVKTTVFVTNLNDFSTINKIYEEYFPDNPPARSTIQVAALPLNAQIEIECIAIKK